MNPTNLQYILLSWIKNYVKFQSHMQIKGTLCDMRCSVPFSASYDVTFAMVYSMFFMQ